jgi:preprotein translocase subunit SecG
METVALVILLLLAFGLIGVVLLQRNEGGGLGMGAGGAITGRAQATALQRATWWLGGGFLAMSLVLTIIAAQEAGESSVVDQIRAGGAEEADEAPALPDLGEGSLLPPSADGEGADAPLVPAGD